VLFLSAAILFLFMLFFADPGEGVVVQATMMGGVMVLVTSLLLLLAFLDNPYTGDLGTLEPTAMESTLRLMQREAGVIGGAVAPCDTNGLPSRA